MVDNQPGLDDGFLALAHPVRRAIVARLAVGPATVAEAARDAPVSKQAVTKHLRVLERAGVIVREVEGRTHRLRLDARPLAEASAWIAAQRELWERKLDVVEEYLAERRPDPRSEEER